MWLEIVQIVTIICLVLIALIVGDTLYLHLKQRMLDAIPVKQKKLKRVKVHDVGPELLELMRRKKLTTLIFNKEGVFTLKKGELNDR